MLLSQRQTDVIVMSLSAAGGAVLGAAANAWWWIPVGVAALLLAATLLYRRASQNELNDMRQGQVQDVHAEQIIRRVVAEEIAPLRDEIASWHTATAGGDLQKNRAEGGEDAPADNPAA